MIHGGGSNSGRDEEPQTQQPLQLAALPHIIDVLSLRGSNKMVNLLICRAALAVSSLVANNADAKLAARTFNCIPCMVDLLSFENILIQKAAIEALQQLSNENEENTKEMLNMQIFPLLVSKLGYPPLCSLAIQMIVSLVGTSSQRLDIALTAGALQPVIELLSSDCASTLIQGATFLNQMACSNRFNKIRLAKRGVLKPLFNLLRSNVYDVRATSIMILQRLVEDEDEDILAAVVSQGGILPLVELLDSEHVGVNVAFVLYQLAKSEDNVLEFMTSGVVRRLLDHENQQINHYVSNTMTFLKTKMNSSRMEHLLYLMQEAPDATKKHVAVALALFTSWEQHQRIFIYKDGLKRLVELLGSQDPMGEKAACAALLKVAGDGSRPFYVDVVHPPQQMLRAGIIMDLKHLQNPNIIFKLQGVSIYANKESCCAASKVFEKLLESGYRETGAFEITIEDMRVDVFKTIISYISLGSSVTIDSAILIYVLKAADQYQLDGLKRLCEQRIAEAIDEQSLPRLYKISRVYNALFLRHRCLIFFLERFSVFHSIESFSVMVEDIIPDFQICFPLLFGPNDEM